jgi:hypothetical protein
MTEEEWLASQWPEPMMVELKSKASDRKLRLFDICCCRRLAPYYAVIGLCGVPEAIDRAELFADGLVSEEELKRAQAALARSCFNDEEKQVINIAAHADLAIWTILTPAWEDQGTVHEHLWLTDAWEEMDPQRQFPNEKFAKEFSILSNYVRDIFGNPFRPVAFAPEWRTDSAIAIAKQMYESRDFSAMPILADALQDAGCDNDAILSHCRGPGPHVRGCWVVDLVLGKE